MCCRNFLPVLLALLLLPVSLAAESIRLHGMVVDGKTGEPVEGARVAMPHFMELLGPSPEPIMIHESISGSDGSWEMVVPTEDVVHVWMSLDVRGLVRLVVSADGHPTLGYISRRSVTEDGIAINFEFFEGHSISGVIHNEVGEPVEGALVGYPTLFPNGLESGMLDIEEFHYYAAQTKSDGGGRFELWGLPEGKEFILPIRANGYINTDTGVITVGNGKVEVVVRKGSATILGSVRQIDGEPELAGRVVLWHQSDDIEFGNPLHQARRVYEVPVDGRGDFVAEGLEPGSYQIVASASGGFPNQHASSGPVASAHASLGENERTEVVLTLPGERTVSGRVVAAGTDHPIRGVRLTTMGGQHLVGKEGYVVYTDDSGRFELKGLLEKRGNDTVFPLQFEFPGGWMLEPGTGRFLNFTHLGVDADGSLPDVLLEAVPARNLRVVVMLGDGESPLVGEVVRLRHQETGQLMSRMTDQAGVIEFTAPKPSNFTYSIGSTSGWAEGEFLVDEDTGEMIQIALAGNGTISGFVRDADGSGIADVAIELRRPMKDWEGDPRMRPRTIHQTGVKSESDGSFHVEDVSPGPLEVHLKRDTIPDGFARPTFIEMEVEADGTHEGLNFILHRQ